MQRQQDEFRIFDRLEALLHHEGGGQRLSLCEPCGIDNRIACVQNDTKNIFFPKIFDSALRWREIEGSYG